MNSLITAPVVALDSPAWGVPLSGEELEGTVGGGFDPIAAVLLAFTASVIVGVLDRLFFGGCRCR